ncbi:Transcription factor PfmaH like protein [Verticillium longisporum]|nr:Transcription factor PfmaH like protein [Verticillium longisporum]
MVVEPSKLHVLHCISEHTITMVFCAYCGKSFTRKEHLERHIPSHTNVKPHRCSACQLSFARRDLLQRHHSTYHEARDPMEPLPGGVPTVAGRTPIACQNCANAKTGCDKRVPCSRCAEKNLPCAARFARRSSKAAVRAAQASATFQQQLMPPGVQGPQPVHPITFMDITPTLSKQASPPQPPTSAVPQTDQIMTSQKSSPSHSHRGSVDFPSPSAHAEALEEFMQLDGIDNTDFMNPNPNYQDMMTWPDYSLDFDMYGNAMGSLPQDLSMPTFADFSDIASTSDPMTTASSRGSTHTRSTSIISAADFEASFRATVEPVVESISGEASIAEFEVVVAAENSWPLARCNPPIYSSTCPRTAIVHLECLERKCKEEGTWSPLEKYIDTVDWDSSDLATVIPMTSRTRDRMLAITQSFLHKALDVHRGGISKQNPGYSSPSDFSFIVLPPPKILEYFLRSYVRSLSYYYPLVVAGCVDPNEMLINNQASTLLVLLMIAQGASVVPMAEARYLSAGLIETCRISLFDMIEKDVELSADPVALRCALLFTTLGAWSGDKWLMDIAMGQRGMYLSMLRHAGMLEIQPSMVPVPKSTTSSELQWRAWLHRELQNRLVYNWVIADQELSLFHDTPPMLAITDLRCPLPSPEALWMSSSSEQCQHLTSKTVTKSSTLQRLEEVQALLQRWYEIAMVTYKANPSCETTRCNLVLFHVISLNAVSSFPEIERLARREGLNGTLWELSMRHKLCLFNPEEAVFHCGQIMRLIRAMPSDRRPCWWSAAVYRATLILWANTVTTLDPTLQTAQQVRNSSSSPVSSNVDEERRQESTASKDHSLMDASIIIDQVTPEDPCLIRYLWSGGKGIIMVTRRDGRTVGLESPPDVLNYGIGVIDEGFTSRIGDGIKRKLASLNTYWRVDSPDIPVAPGMA